MFLRLLLGAVVLIAAAPVTARQDARVTRIDARDGLSHNTVNDIMQSRDGYLWIATYDGLNRYNGQEFEVFRFPAQPDSLGRVFSNVMDNLFEDDAGRIWFTSVGVGYLDRSEQRLVMAHPTPWPDHRGQYRIAVDPSGAVWECGARESGHCGLVESDSAVYIPEDLTAWDPRFDADGALWWAESDSLGTSLVLYRRNRAGVESRTAEGVQLRPATQQAFTIARDGRLWFSGERPGVFEFESGGFSPIPGWPTGLLASVVRELSDGTLLLGTPGGIHQWDPVERTLGEESLAAESTPIGLWVQEIVEDREGLIWLGTRSGLYRLGRQPLPFDHVGSGLASDPDGLPVALEMVVDETGVWVGTLGRGLVRVEGDKFTEYSRRAGTLCGDQAWSTLRVESTLWVSTEAGLCEMAPDGSFRWMRTSEDGGVLARASSGGVWYWNGDARSPIVQLDRTGEEMLRVHADLQPWSLFDDGRHLWIGAAGLHRFRLGAFDRMESLGLLQSVVIDIRAGQDSLLWLATDLGPVRFDMRTSGFAFVETEMPPPGRVTYSLAEDDTGSLWMGTNRGLVRVDPESGGLRVYGAEDGVRNLEFDRRAFAEGPDGRYYFGGLDGVTVFRPADVVASPHAPTVAIAEIQVEQAGRPASRVSIGPEGALSIPPRAHSLTFRLDPLLHSDPGRSRTRYRLVGYDPDWIDGRDVRYSRLAPGHYQFQARAISVDDVMGPVTEVSIRVRPRFWQTWWFRFLVVASASGIVWAFVSIRRAHRRRVEAMRLRIATDLHDEVGSHLSAIAMMADVIRKRSADGRLEEIAASARGMVQRLREIVWAVDPSMDHAGTLAEHIREIAGAMLNGHAWELTADAADLSRPLDIHLRHQVALIVREAFHNVVRHAGADSVSISLLRRREGLTLRIEDDGCGFGDASTGHGLASMEQRARSLGGDLQVDSAPGSGTRLVLRVPWNSGSGWRNRAMQGDALAHTVGGGTR